MTSWVLFCAFKVRFYSTLVTTMLYLIPCFKLISLHFTLYQFNCIPIRILQECESVKHKHYHQVRPSIHTYHYIYVAGREFSPQTTSIVGHICDLQTLKPYKIVFTFKIKTSQNSGSATFPIPYVLLRRDTYSLKSRSYQMNYYIVMDLVQKSYARWKGHKMSM